MNAHDWTRNLIECGPPFSEIERERLLAMCVRKALEGYAMADFLLKVFAAPIDASEEWDTCPLKNQFAETRLVQGTFEAIENAILDRRRGGACRDR